MLSLSGLLTMVVPRLDFSSGFRYRRYKLRQVMVNGDLPPSLKKDAHDIILEFIRSRPPLKPVLLTINQELFVLLCSAIGSFFDITSILTRDINGHR